MLVLSRRVGERIFIGKDREIVLEVVEIRRDRIRLGIVAPGDVPIHREEVALAMDAEKEWEERNERQ